ncbi:MAG: PEP-CTERM sorting domain-containing protein [Gammaproteobacteria bacterium]|nr:PEP-CTERM sorting domain-containing protein [Gammaproteobacteria bacterium]
MKTIQRLSITLLLLPFVALADPIVTTFDGPDAPDELGGFTMTDFAPPACPGESCAALAYEAESPIDGSVVFQTRSGDALGMTVYDPLWWEYDQGNVYTTTVSWVELIMPRNTNAFSFFVGASFFGRGWIEAYDGNGDTAFTRFRVGPGDTPGFGVFSTDACSSITKIIVEPQDWGVGGFSINQGQNESCASVPEPAPIGLLGIGLLALAASRKFLGTTR